MPTKEEAELKKLSALLNERILFVEALIEPKYYLSFPVKHRQKIAAWLNVCRKYQQSIEDGKHIDLLDLNSRVHFVFEAQVNLNDPRIKVLNALIVEQKRMMDDHKLTEDKSAEHNLFGEYKIMTAIFNPIRSPQSTIANNRAIEIGKLAKEISDDLQKNPFINEQQKSDKINDLYLKLNILSKKMQGTTKTSQLFRKSTGKNIIQSLADSIKPKQSFKEKIMNTFKGPGKK